jgi:type I restriction enzyme S subunit
MTHEVPEGWQSKPLSDLGEYQNGRAFKPSDWGTEGLPIIRIAQINNPYSETNYYSGTDVQEKHLIRDGDLLFSWSATLTALLWRNGNGILNQHIFKVVENEGVDKNFLLYTILHSIDGLAGHSHGTTMKHIKKGVLNKYHVGIPPLPEQKKIAEVLSSVDEAIAATKAVIDQTKQVKKGLLQTLLTKGIGHTKFKQTELGEIPESWEVGSLSEVIDDMKYGTSSKCDASDNGYGVLRIPNVVDERINLKDMKYAELSASEAARYSLVDGDILAVRTNGNPNYIGRMAVVSSLPKNTIFASYLIRIRVDRSKVMPEFIHYAALSPNTRAALLKSAKTSAGNYNINSTGLGSIKLSIPPLSEQREIAQVFQNIDASLETYEAHLQQLQTLKFGLMSDLLTGRKRVEV